MSAADGTSAARSGPLACGPDPAAGLLETWRAALAGIGQAGTAPASTWQASAGQLAAGQTGFACVVRDRAASAPSPWSVRLDGFYAHARPDGAVLPDQGWKIHVSTRPDNALATLTRCADVLICDRTPFKFAQDLAVAYALVSARYERLGRRSSSSLTRSARSTARRCCVSWHGLPPDCPARAS